MYDNKWLPKISEDCRGLARHSDEQARPVYAAIDLGTTSCRLVIASPTPTSFQVIETFSKVTRLGEGIINDNELSRHAIRRTVAALRRFTARGLWQRQLAAGQKTVRNLWTWSKERPV